jgi:diketogulonate reductase-like aldo/keto reductase
MASKYKVSAAQIMLCWAKMNKYVILPRALNESYIMENMNLSFDISPDDMNELNKLNENYAKIIRRN